MSTAATLPRLTSIDLSKIILSQSPSNLDAPPVESKIAIIDVRDADHIGGHIKGSTHVPSSTLEHKIPELVRKLKDKETVVFHCALSQQRGPSAALKYIRERDRLLGQGAKVESGSGVGQVLKKTREEDMGEEKDGEWEDDIEGENKEQKVYVLDRGFVGWQERYGEDVRLTEGYRKEIWKDGYWM